MKQVPTDDPRITRTMSALEGAPVRDAYVDPDDNLHLHTRDLYIVVIAPEGRAHRAYNPADTLPVTTEDPAATASTPSPSQGEGSRSTQSTREGKGLDDFTAIDGVGPVTAQKLHDLGLYTYDDLRTWLPIAAEDSGLSDHTLAQIEGWLEERLC